jgi:hypothetical protein
MLSSSEELKDLKQNEFYSSKGMALPFELGSLYNTLSLELPVWEYRLHLDKREVYAYPVVVEKSNSLVVWSFCLQDFDVGFGLFKVNLLKSYDLEDYNECHECKAVVKMAKYGLANNSKGPVKGHAFLKTGLYHLVFDNSHSMVRGKDLGITVVELEATS